MSGKKYHKLDFSALEDEVLIDKVRENPSLYAKKLKSYKDMKIKDNIWAQISKEIGELGFNRTECKKRWSNLRDYYVRKNKTISTGSAASSQGNEKFDHMKFLDSTAFVHRTTKSNVSTADAAGQARDDGIGDGSDIDRQNEETENRSIVIEKTIIEENYINETQETTATANQVIEIDKADEPLEKIASTKRLTTQSDAHGRTKTARTQLLEDIEKGIVERMTLLRNIAQRATNSIPQSVEDPIDMFFKSLAATAKTLSPRNWVEAKRKLFLVMADIEEKNIEEKYPSNTSSVSGRASSNPSSLPECLSSNPSALPALLPMPSPFYSLSQSDDSPSDCHVIEQTEYENPDPSLESLSFIPLFYQNK